jgi:hypothetical protein
VGLVLGYMGVPLLSGSNSKPIPLFEQLLYVLGGAVFSIFSFLTHARVPPSAVFAIEDERRKNPSGPCSSENLRLFALNTLFLCLALLAWLLGSYVSRVEQTNRTFLNILLLLNLGFILGVAACWKLLKISQPRA